MHFKNEARRFLDEARGDDPLLACLRGDLGAGKTTFVKAALAELGYAGASVQSPTFLKLLEYKVPGFGLVVHIDGYRIDDADGFEKLALETYSEARAWFVEWPALFLKHLAERETLRAHLGFKSYWELELKLESELEEKKVGSIREPGGRGEEHSGASGVGGGRGILWRRKSF